MANYKYNPQLVSAHDIIKPSQVVLGQHSPVSYMSAQPPGYAIRLNADADKWVVHKLGVVDEQAFVADCDTLKQAKVAIAHRHNEREKQLRPAAVAWVDEYQKYPNLKLGIDPQLLEAIYKAAARARIHPDDQTKHDNGGDPPVVPF